LAGFCVGAVERGAVLPRLDAQKPGDLLIAVGSSGPHSNGYSLIRRIVEHAGLGWDSPAPFAPGSTVAEALMTPTRIYIKSILPLLKAGLVTAVAHITGGGLIENPPRVIAKALEAEFDWHAWSLPPVFAWLQQAGGVSDQEMRRTFNCGVGLVLVVPPQNAEPVLAALLNAGETAFVCGQLAVKAQGPAKVQGPA
jgi:phosphoribosylaminoimidazole synthetase